MLRSFCRSTIVEYLQKIFDDASVGIGWVYCIYNEVGQTARSFLATLLHQFCQQKGPLSPEISKSYQEHCRHDTPPTVHELLSLLQSQVQRFAKVYIVIDALDEFPDGLRDTFLAELKKLPSSVHLLVTSRPDSSIESNLPDPKRLDISAHDDDVRQHLAARIANNSLLKSHIAADASLEDTIISKVTEKAGGMYVKNH